MNIDADLFEVLQCPSCRGDLAGRKKSLECVECGQQFPVSDGIPDFTFFRSGDEQEKFNRVQASYEAVLHGEEAQCNYEETVIKVFGTKTRLIAENWANANNKSSNVRVLDYGCGTGQLSRVLARRFKPLYTFDISSISVRTNVSNNRVLGCVANAFFLPFKDNSFDVVCINRVLHHIVDLKTAIGEISRIAKCMVYVSEGIPRPRPGFGRVSAYPGLSRKFLYTLYVIYYMARIFGGVCFMMTNILSRNKREQVAHGSRYERALDVSTVETLFDQRQLLFPVNDNYNSRRIASL